MHLAGTYTIFKTYCKEAQKDGKIGKFPKLYFIGREAATVYPSGFFRPLPLYYNRVINRNNFMFAIDILR